MTQLQESCFPALKIKLKYLCLTHRKHPDQAHLWMASRKKKLIHPLWSLAGTRKYSITLPFSPCSSPPTLCSIKKKKRKKKKKPSIQTQARWLFGTLVHHLFGLLAFQIKSQFLAPTPFLLIYQPVLWWAEQSLDLVLMKDAETERVIPMQPCLTYMQKQQKKLISLKRWRNEKWRE